MKAIFLKVISVQIKTRSTANSKDKGVKPLVQFL